MKSARARLAELVEAAELGKLTARAAAAAAIQIGAEALDCVRIYENKKGEQREVPQPDNRGAIAALDFACSISGLKPGEKSESAESSFSAAELIEQARPEFNARGYDIVPLVRQ